jgi:hypothetical protein
MFGMEVVSSRLVPAIPVPHPDHGLAELLIGGEKVMGGRSLSLTLQKLYIWEKKLYDEVKVCARSCLLMSNSSMKQHYVGIYYQVST